MNESKRNIVSSAEERREEEKRKFLDAFANANSEEEKFLLVQNVMRSIVWQLLTKEEMKDKIPYWPSKAPKEMSAKKPVISPEAERARSAAPTPSKSKAKSNGTQPKKKTLETRSVPEVGDAVDHVMRLISRENGASLSAEETKGFQTQLAALNSGDREAILRLYADLMERVRGQEIPYGVFRHTHMIIRTLRLLGDNDDEYDRMDDLLQEVGIRERR